MIKPAIVGFLALVFAWSGIGSARAHSPEAAARAELAPDGTLRLGIIDTNPVIVAKGPDGRLAGLGVDLGQALAQRLAVPLAPVPFASGRDLFEALKAGRLRIGLLAIAPARAAEVAFSPPYVEIESTFLVPAGSPIAALADVDRAGVRVAVIEKSSQDFHLSKTLKHASLVRLTEGATERGLALLRAGEVEAFAGNTHRLSGAVAQLAGARVLPGRFLKADYAFALPKDTFAGLDYVARFVAEAKESGLIRDAIARAGLTGVVVAP